ncbi:MAG: branched-chain amino acid ABC transporter permease [Pseudomonadales bacterium]
MRFIRKTQYQQDVALFKHNGQRFWYGLLMLLVLMAPLFLDTFYLGELSLVYIYAIAGIGLMLLVGYTGLVSLGHAAFLAIGAYTHSWFMARGWPLPLSMLMAGLVSASAGALVGRPTLRMTGIYLAIATLAFANIVEQIIAHWEPVTGGFRGQVVPDAMLAGFDLGFGAPFYYLCLITVVLCLIVGLNLLRTSTGRSMAAIRDSEISAQSMGINLARTKTIAFSVSAGFTGVAGSLFAHKLGYLTPDAFTMLTSIQLLLLVVIGGLGSMHGVFYGAIFIVILPQAIAILRDSLPSAIGQLPGLEPGMFGLILVLILIYEPHGIYGRWLKIQQFFSEFPLYRRATHKRQKSYLRTERVR